MTVFLGIVIGVSVGVALYVIDFLSRFSLEYYLHHIGMTNRFLTVNGNKSIASYESWKKKSLLKRAQKVLMYMNKNK